MESDVSTPPSVSVKSAIQNLLLLLSFCLLTTFLLQSYLSPERWHAWIKAAVQHNSSNWPAGTDLQWQEQELVLSQHGGLWPVFAVRLKGISIHAPLSENLRKNLASQSKLQNLLFNDKRDKIGNINKLATLEQIKDFDAEISELLISFHFWHLITQSVIRVKTIESPDITLRLLASSLDRPNQADPLEMKIVNLKLFLGTESSVSKISYSGQAKLEWPKGNSWGDALEPLSIKFTRDQLNTYMQVKTSVEEGLLNLNAEAKSENIQKLESIKVKFDIVHLPLRHLLSALENGDWISKLNFQPDYLWLTCRGEFNLQHQVIQGVQLQICQVDGKVGKSQISYQPDLNKWNIHINDLNLRQTLQMAGVSGLDGIIKEYGNLTGQVEILSPQHIEVTSEVRGAEILFSSQGEKKSQPVSHLAMRISYDRAKGLTELKLHGLELQDGDADGGYINLRWRLNRRAEVDSSNMPNSKSVADLEMDFPQIKWKSEVAMATYIEDIRGLRLTAQTSSLHSADEFWRNLQGQASVGAINFAGADLKNVELNWKGLQLAIKAEQAQNHSNSSATWLFPDSSLYKKVEKINARLKLENRNLTWENAKATVFTTSTGQRLKIQSSGLWDSTKRELKGEWQFTTPRLRRDISATMSSTRWQFKGPPLQWIDCNKEKTECRPILH